MSRFRAKIPIEASIDDQVIDKVVEELYSLEPYSKLGYTVHYELPMPSIDALSEAISLSRTIIFPGYFGKFELPSDSIWDGMHKNLERLSFILLEQIFRAFCFECSMQGALDCAKCEKRAKEAAGYLISSLPKIRQLLMTDVKAAYEYDPAAKCLDEVILCYPSIRAITNYRIAHELYVMHVPLVPRIFTEMAHSETGIDIHPGAKIGERFFMDHGTGIVIGETCIIGRNVRIYQGVTLGAKSFPLDDKGKPIKGVLRHPIVEDDVIVYAGATILGRVRIGRGAVIGSNVTVTRDVPPGTKIVQRRPKDVTLEKGAGI